MWDLCSLQKKTLTLASLCSAYHTEMRNGDIPAHCKSSLSKLGLEQWGSAIFLFFQITLKNQDFGNDVWWAISAEGRTDVVSIICVGSGTWDTWKGRSNRLRLLLSFFLLWKLLKFIHKFACILTYSRSAGWTVVKWRASHCPWAFLNNSCAALKQKGVHGSTTGCRPCRFRKVFESALSSFKYLIKWLLNMFFGIRVNS